MESNARVSSDTLNAFSKGKLSHSSPRWAKNAVDLFTAEVASLTRLLKKDDSYLTRVTIAWIGWRGGRVESGWCVVGSDGVGFFGVWVGLCVCVCVLTWRVRGGGYRISRHVLIRLPSPSQSAQCRVGHPNKCSVGDRPIDCAKQPARKALVSRHCTKHQHP